MSGAGVLAVAGDPLLRKALGEALASATGIGDVTVYSPTRANADRVSQARAVILAGGDSDAGVLRAPAKAAVAAGRALVVVAVCKAGSKAPALDQLGANSVVEVPDLNIRDELARASSKIAAALRKAEDRMKGSGAAPIPVAKAEVPASATSSSAPSPAPRPPIASGANYLGVVICVGASTGGTDALLEILSKTPRTTPPIVIVQHMPENYVGDFAARLDWGSPMDVALAQDDLALRPGLAVVAPGGRQLRLKKDAAGIWTQSGEVARFGGHSPAADVLMSSAADQLGRKAIGVLLTGMGRDGADGLLAMRRAGARTVAQDEATSVVYGMPRAAHEIGAADTIVGLPKMAEWISGLVMSFR